jgi:hypothetical protein
MNDYGMARGAKQSFVNISSRGVSNLARRKPGLGRVPCPGLCRTKRGSHETEALAICATSADLKIGPRLGCVAGAADWRCYSAVAASSIRSATALVEPRRRGVNHEALAPVIGVFTVEVAVLG